MLRLGDLIPSSYINFSFVSMAAIAGPVAERSKPDAHNHAKGLGPGLLSADTWISWEERLQSSSILSSRLMLYKGSQSLRLQLPVGMGILKLQTDFFFNGPFGIYDFVMRLLTSLLQPLVTIDLM